LVDTGGWEVGASGIHLRVAEQAEVAVELADVVVFVVDAVIGSTDTDEAVVRLLRRSGKPVVLVANKVDDQRFEADATALWNLGLGQPWPVSALHGGGAATCSTRSSRCSPTCRRSAVHTSEAARDASPCSAARTSASPSLLNKLAGSERVVVDSVAGHDARPGRRAGRAGRQDLAVRRHGGHPATRAPDPRARTSTRRCEPRPPWRRPRSPSSSSTPRRPIAEQDIRVIQQVVDTGRALVVAYNKWDLLDEERRYYLEREIERELVQIQWAPRVNLSALTGRHLDRLVPALELALDSWETRVPTGRLNAFLGEIVAGHPHPVRGGKQPRILFATQAATQPPRFVVFASGFIEAGTAGSSSGGCARSSGSRGRRSRCRSGFGRSAAGSRFARSPGSPRSIGAERRTSWGDYVPLTR
jgi:GTP-binding protein